MVKFMEIAQIRANWMEVLDVLEGEDRIAWLAFFDARLASIEGSTLLLDFSDSRKFATAHDYAETRKHLYVSLQKAIQAVYGIDLTVIEKP
jgi:hypothetical protein